MTLFRLIWWSDFTGAMSITLPFENGKAAWEFMTAIPGINLNKKCAAFIEGDAIQRWHNGQPITTKNGFARL